MAFWGDKIADEVERHCKDVIERGDPLIIRDEKTASGRVHAGSMRSVALHGIVSEILRDRSIDNVFHFEINDFDPMDGLPVYLDERVYREHMGKPLCAIPSPDGTAKNFATYYGEEYAGVITDTGFNVNLYYSTELYLSGKMNEVIRMALERADRVRAIYKAVSNSHKPDDWHPLQVICEQCGKVATTKLTGFDGEKVAYVCQKDLVTFAAGCGHEGNMSPFDGNAKLSWKVDWAAKFKVMGVQFEGAGKDHYTKGGARHAADAISREIFDYEPPYGVQHEFFLIGGKKMSSSKGSGSSAREIADLLPPRIFRLALFGGHINRQVNFDPSGETIPMLYDRYDRLSEKYFSGEKDDDTRVFEMIHRAEERAGLTERFLPRFSLISFLVQMPHINLEETVAAMKATSLTEADREELMERSHYAKIWLNAHAADEYKYVLQEILPEASKGFSDAQRKALQKLVQYIEQHEKLDGQTFHTALHDIRKEIGLDPKEFFGALYISLLGKESGPKAGWFLSVLERDFLIARLTEVATG